jgi:hypothetical protein
MLKRLLTLFGTAAEATPPHAEYDPVYGLPRWRVEQWLARNPSLREQYEVDAWLARNPSLRQEADTLTRTALGVTTPDGARA